MQLLSEKSEVVNPQDAEIMNIYDMGRAGISILENCVIRKNFAIAELKAMLYNVQLDMVHDEDAHSSDTCKKCMIESLLLKEV